MLDWKTFIEIAGQAFGFISNLLSGPKIDTKHNGVTKRTNFSEIWYKLFLKYKSHM